jgi:hypothetical protein
LLLRVFVHGSLFFLIAGVLFIKKYPLRPKNGEPTQRASFILCVFILFIVLFLAAAYFSSGAGHYYSCLSAAYNSLFKFIDTNVCRYAKPVQQVWV